MNLLLKAIIAVPFIQLPTLKSSGRPWTSPDRCGAASREMMAFKDFKCDKKKAFPICEVPNPGKNFTSSPF